MPHDRVASALVACLTVLTLACKGNAPGESGEANEAKPTAGVEEAVGAGVESAPATAVESAPATALEPAPPRAGETAARPMMVEFSRDYCTPCQVMKPWVAEIAIENSAVDVLSVNVDRKKYEHIGSFFHVTAVPSLIFVGADGQIIRRSEGLAKKEQMSNALRELGWAR
jgi:thiol:disulfide interchange protein